MCLCWHPLSLCLTCDSFLRQPLETAETLFSLSHCEDRSLSEIKGEALPELANSLIILFCCGVKQPANMELVWLRAGHNKDILQEVGVNGDLDADRAVRHGSAIHSSSWQCVRNRKIYLNRWHNHCIVCIIPLHFHYTVLPAPFVCVLFISSILSSHVVCVCMVSLCCAGPPGTPLGVRVYICYVPPFRRYLYLLVVYLCVVYLMYSRHGVWRRNC